jgi:alpha-beta hydrolase superfamily lysophospholipase
VEHFYHTEWGKEYKTIPRIIFGNSMGGLISTKLIMEESEQKKWNAAILASPLIKADPNIAHPLYIEIGKIFCKILPKLPVGESINPSHVTKSVEYQKIYQNSEKNYRGRVRINTGIQIVNTIDQVNDNFSKIKLPILRKLQKLKYSVAWNRR